MPPVAVIDIGSNTIKLLVADRDPAGNMRSLAMRTLEARISAGIGGAVPTLSAEGIARGVAAVKELSELAAQHAPTQTQLVATSAVRDAANGADFVAQVLATTGHTIRILGGDEEANFIGRGLTADPALAHLQDFHVFDLGGGSLECLAFRAREIQQAFSAKLGCVRLTERFVTDAHGPLTANSETQLRDHVRAELLRLGFAGHPGAAAVFAGGSMTTVRAILGAEANLDLNATAPRVPVDTLRSLLDRLRPLDLVARRAIPGMPASRADVFPAALVTMITVAELGGFDAFQHSFYNLRWGLADALLDAAV